MTIAIGSDHVGFGLKQTLVQWLRANNFAVLDVGTNDTTSVDFPDFAQKVAEAVASGACVRGIGICGSGIGVNIAANKVKGIRASVCHDIYSAHQGVEHDDMNILVLGSRIIGEVLAQEIVRTFLHAKFMPEERYVRRVNKIVAIENSCCNKKS